MKHIRTATLVTAFVLIVAACGSGEDAPDEIVLMTHGSFAVSEGVIESFTDETGVTVTVLEAGDAGSMVNQAILTKDNPVADVLFGIDNTFLSRAEDEDLFLPYRAANLDLVADELHVPSDLATPIDVGYVCVNVDPATFDQSDVETPTRLADLTDPTYRGMFVVEDPSTSSPGLAFLLSTISIFGEDGSYTWQSYWRDLVANDVQIVPGWEQAYYGEFSGGSGEGDRPAVVSYATSPVAEVYFSDLDAAPTGIIDDGCFRQIEYAAILSGTESEPTAQLLVDFLLARPFQDDIALNMFVYPANEETELPAVFVEFAAYPTSSISMDPSTIDTNRERWLAEWESIVR